MIINFFTNTLGFVAGRTNRALFKKALLISYVVGITACTTTAPDGPVNTVTGIWLVHAIDEQPVISDTPVTLTFKENGRVSGFAGCNQYSGVGSMNDERATFSAPVSTRRMCIEELAQQEQRLFKALTQARYYNYNGNKNIVVYNKEDQAVLKLSRAKDSVATDQSGNVQYLCEGAGVVSMRQVNAEVIELTIADKQPLLTRTRSASGARYAGKEIIFHHQRNEALLDYDNQRFGCQQR